MLNRLDLSFIPLKGRVFWNYSFSATAGSDFLGKTRKALLKAFDRKNKKNAIIVDQ